MTSRINEISVAQTTYDDGKKASRFLFGTGRMKGVNHCGTDPKPFEEDGPLKNRNIAQIIKLKNEYDADDNSTKRYAIQNKMMLLVPFALRGRIPHRDFAVLRDYFPNCHSEEMLGFCRNLSVGDRVQVLDKEGREMVGKIEEIYFGHYPQPYTICIKTEGDLAADILPMHDIAHIRRLDSIMVKTDDALPLLTDHLISPIANIALSYYHSPMTVEGAFLVDPKTIPVRPSGRE